MTFPYPKTGSYRDIPLYEELTSPDVAAAVKAGAHVIIATGATEQHAGHLPLGTDTYQCVDIARRAAATLNSEGIPALVGPTIPYGPSAILSECPKNLPGTINISHDTLRALVNDVCRELVAQGFRVIYLLCGHAENDPVLQLVAKEVSETTDASVLTLQWLIGIQPGHREILRSKLPQGHAGESETSRMLVTAPHLVRMDKCASYQPDIPAGTVPHDKMPYLGGAIGRYKYPPKVFEGFEDGLWGDAGNGSAEVGEKSYGLINDWVCQAIRREYEMWKGHFG